MGYWEFLFFTCLKNNIKITLAPKLEPLYNNHNNKKNLINHQPNDEVTMLQIRTNKTGTKYSGTVTLTDEQVAKVEKEFASKFEAFTYGVEMNWTKAMIMKHCLDTTKDQYFYNYYNKYLGSKK